eukprot:5796855-Karenia_brevis.AAC.1
MRISERFPQLIPDRPDFITPSRPPNERQLGWDSSQAGHTVIDFSDVIGKLLKPRSVCSKLFDDWTPSCKPYLLSTLVGGQWPQARLASTRKWTEDD